MESLSHCTWLTRLLIALLKRRPDVFELSVRVPRPETLELSIDEICPDLDPEDLERAYTIQHIERCFNATVEGA